MVGKGNGYGIDDDGAQGVAGYLHGMTKTVETGQYIGSVITYVHGILAPRFDRHMDMIAKGSGARFHHVYEWPSAYGAKDTLGNPAFRLWRQTLRGNGKTKSASFRFIASRRAVPVHPLAATPSERTGKHVKVGFHIFYWKAAVMEFGLNVSISPTLGDWLTLVPPKSNFLVFTKKTIEMQGGTPYTRGAFTKAFADWWENDADKYFNQNIGPSLARDLVKTGALSRRTGISKPKTFTITTGGRNGAYAAAEARARKDMKKNEREYILGSLERMGNIGRL